MREFRERVMSEMLSEQSAPEGAKKWYRRPAMVMQPAGAEAGRRARSRTCAPGAAGQQCGRASAAASQRRLFCARSHRPGSACCEHSAPAAPAHPPGMPAAAWRRSLTRIGAQCDAQQRLEVERVLLARLHPRVVPVLGHVLRHRWGTVVFTLGGKDTLGADCPSQRCTRHSGAAGAAAWAWNGAPAACLERQHPGKPRRTTNSSLQGPSQRSRQAGRQARGAQHPPAG